MKLRKLKERHSNALIFLGVLLFFLGLIVGLFVHSLANPRMGLSSHLEGIMNGMFLIILGLIWHKVKLSERWLKITFWLSIYGTFANWLGILIAAIFNAGADLTIAAEGQEGGPIAETVVTFALITLTLAMFIICIAVLTGLYKHNKISSEKDPIQP